MPIKKRRGNKWLNNWTFILAKDKEGYMKGDKANPKNLGEKHGVGFSFKMS